MLLDRGGVSTRMANGHVDEVRRQLCRLFAAGSASGLGDGELVQRLVDRGSEAAGSAFETILTRHGSVESHARAEVPLRCATQLSLLRATSSQPELA
jgi:hypothetical protein